MARKTVSFNTTTEEAQKISAIVARAKAIDPTVDMEALSMDIADLHVNGCPLDLDRFLAAELFNFVHDIAGIMRHLDRETGQLKNCFLPRFALPEAAHADA